MSEHIIVCHRHRLSEQTIFIVQSVHGNINVSTSDIHCDEAWKWVKVSFLIEVKPI